MNPRLSIAALLLACASLPCLADAPPEGSAPAARPTAAERQAARQAKREERLQACSAAVNRDLDRLAADSAKRNPHWSPNQRYQLDDAIATARNIPWGALDADGALAERQAALVLSRDERLRAASVSQTGRQAKSLYPDSISKNDAARAGAAAESSRALWMAMAQADAAALRHSRCLRAPR